MKLLLTSPIPPSVNHCRKLRVINQHGKARAMSYKTKRNTDYREEFANYVIAECERQGWNWEPNKTQHFCVEADFYFNRTDMDTNNYWKVLLDAITDTQKIWLDDNVVCERVRRIYYDSANPRIELTISPVDYIGIFDSAQQLDEFTARCQSCARYTRSCSILRKAKEGRIQSEIINGECIKHKQATEKKEI